MYRLIKCLLICVSCAMIPKSKVDNVFTRHTSEQIVGMFDVLDDYSRQKCKVSFGIDEIMYSDMSFNLRGGKYHAEKKGDKLAVYLGWTPLANDNIMLRSDKPTRNDNVGASFRHIPLYFIFLTPFNHTLYIERIIHNPSIEIKVDVCLLKDHLATLARESNTTLNIKPLKTYDNGRWYFEMSELYNLTST